MEHQSDILLKHLCLACEFYIWRQEYFRKVGTFEANKHSNDAYESLIKAVFHVTKYLN